MIETKMYKILRDTFPKIFFQRIETTTGLGVPDVFFAGGYVSGWMELKQLKSWPAKPMTNVKIPWRPGQLAWASRYMSKTTSPYYLVLTIGHEWFFMKRNCIASEYRQADLKINYYVEDLKELSLV
jgi:hypothetical protein